MIWNNNPEHIWNIPWISPGHLSWPCSCQLLMHPLTGRVWESEVLDLGKNYSAAAKTWLCLQLCSQTKSKMLHYTSYSDENELSPSQNQDNKLYESLNSKVRKEACKYMEGYCKLCFLFFPFIEDENMMQHRSAILFSPSISFSLMSLGKKGKKAGWNKPLCSPYIDLLGVF